MTEPKEIIEHKLHDVARQMEQPDQFNHYILNTLDSFAYRYFENPSKARALTPTVMVVEAIEVGIKEAIKIKNPELRQGLGELVKKFSKDEGPTVKRELRVEILERNPGRGGKAVVYARISFGHPEHDYKKGSFVEKKDSFSFEEEIHFRNHLALHLEKVSELFE